MRAKGGAAVDGGNKGQGGEGKGEGRQTAASEAAGGQSEGAGGRDWGVGTTNAGSQEAAKMAEAVTERMPPRFSGDRSQWREHFEKLYESRALQTEGNVERVTGVIGQGEFQGGVEVKGAAPRAQTRTGPSQVFMQYSESQKDALSKENIPVGVKAFVKGYFDALEKQ